MTAMAKVEVLRAACCIAGADGNVDDGELVLLKRLAAKVWALAKRRWMR